MKNEKEISIDTTEIERIIREHYEQLYANQMDNLDETDRFLHMYNLRRLKEKEIENMNRPIISTEIENAILKLSENKSRTWYLHRWIHQIFREELIPLLLKLFQKTAVEGTLVSSFYKTTITLILKPDKDTTKVTSQYHWWTQMQKSSTKY